MKKILAILLAVCLVLSLSISIIADESVSDSVEAGTIDIEKPADDANEEPGDTEATEPVESEPAGPSVVEDPDDGDDKKTGYVYDSEGNLLGDVIVTPVAEDGDIYAEVLEYGKDIDGYTVIGVYVVEFIGTAVDEVTGELTFDVYAPGVAMGDTVLVRDEWEEGLAELVAVDGDRAKVTMDADMIKEWEYFAIVSTGDENPDTGIVLAVLPMMVAAAAIVVSKRR